MTDYPTCTITFNKILRPGRLVVLVDEHRMADALGRALGRYRQRERHEVMIRTDWNRGDLSALMQVVREPGCSTSDLADADFVRPQTMIRHIEALEDAGMIVRRTDPADARRRLIYPTEAGKRLLSRQRLNLYGWLEEAIAGLPENEKKMLPCVIDILDHIAARAERP